MADYPASLASILATKTNDTLAFNDHAPHHNQLADELEAVQAELGIVPSGSHSTVADRLSAQDLRIVNVKDPEYGALGNGTGNDAPAIAAAVLDAQSGTYPGTVVFPPGVYNVDCSSAEGITLPNSKAIGLQGAGALFGPTSIAAPVVLKRSAGNNAIMRNPDVGGQRWNGSIRDLVVDGNAGTGPVAIFQRTGNAQWENIRFRNQATSGVTAPGVQFLGVWNSNLRACFFSQLGLGTSQPATVIGHAGGTDADGITNTFDLSDNEWEVNRGTDVNIKGLGSTATRASHLNWKGGKIENINTDTHPLVQIDDAADLMVVGVNYILSNAKQDIVTVTNTAGGGGVSFTACGFEINGGLTGANYYMLNQLGGNSPVTCNGCVFWNFTANLTAARHMGSSVGSKHALGSGNIYYNEIFGTPQTDNTAVGKRHHDERASKTGPIAGFA